MSALRMLYNSLIYPNLTYGNSLWGAATQRVLNPLIVAQKKIVRAICRKPRRFHTAPLFHDLHFLNITQINRYASCLYTFKSLQRGEEWTVLVNIPYPTRRNVAPTIVVPPVMLTHSRQSGRWVGIQTWNALPAEIRILDSYKLFKVNLKRYLIG